MEVIGHLELNLKKKHFKNVCGGGGEGGLNRL